MKFNRGISLGLILGAVSWAHAGLYIDAGRLSGEDGYRERRLGAGLSLPWIEPETADLHRTISRLWFSALQTDYAIDRASEARRRQFGGGFELNERIGVEGSVWKQPLPDRALTRYEARGWTGAVTFRGPGYQPELQLQGGGTRHTQQVSVQEWFIGAKLTEHFPTKTSLRFSGDHHGYRQNLQALNARSEFVGLRQLPAAASIETLEGFTKYAFGIGLEQQLSEWGRISTDWRRATYALGRSSYSNSLLTRVSLRVARFFRVGAHYEVFNPSRGSTVHIKGLSLTFSF